MVTVRKLIQDIEKLMNNHMFSYVASFIGASVLTRAEKDKHHLPYELLHGH